MPGLVGRGVVFLKIGLHGSEMILAGDVERFVLFGTDVLLDALDADVASQQ
jgi:hypothetical protein